jgi:hypothetical protein
MCLISGISLGVFKKYGKYEDYCYKYKCPKTRPNFMIGSKQFKNKLHSQIMATLSANAFERFTINIKIEKGDEGGIKEIIV